MSGSDAWDVLVVDDDPDVAALVTRLLQSEGYSVRVASNGAEGLVRITDRLPDLVVMDVEMPVLSGPAMAERLFVENLGREDIPLVIVSGVADLESVADAVGTPYHIAKPCLPEELLELVALALRERRLPRPAPRLTARR